MLQDHIIATLLYYDTLDMALTSFEVWQRLVRLKCDACLTRPCKCSSGKQECWDKLTYFDVLLTLDDLVSEGRLSCDDGYYMVARRDLYQNRIARLKIADQKWKKTLKIIRWLGAVPFVRVIFGSGSLALCHTHEKSDLDILVVTKHGRIWTTRSLLLLLLMMLGKHRDHTQEIAEDLICPNHYITDASLHIPYHSVYTAHLYYSLTPIYVSKPVLVDDFLSRNAWLAKYFIHPPTAKLWLSQDKFLPNSRALGWLQRVGEFVLSTGLGAVSEALSRMVQKNRVYKNPATYEADGRVVISDAELEFHPRSPERRIIDTYNERAQALSVMPELDSGLN